MGFIFSKKASSSSDNDSELYQDLHSEDMKTRIDIFTNRSNTLENRLVALRKIGLFTFTAGPIGEDIILESFLDLALFELLDVHTSDILRCQLLQTLSMVCAGKPRVLSSMRKTPNVIRVLVMMIGNYKQPVMSRWACYLTSVMISDSPKTMEAFSDIDDLEDNLDQACNMRGSWKPFGENLAFRLMQLFGYKSPDEEEIRPNTARSKRSRSRSTHSSGKHSSQSPSPRRRLSLANAD